MQLIMRLKENTGAATVKVNALNVWDGDPYVAHVNPTTNAEKTKYLYTGRISAPEIMDLDKHRVGPLAFGVFPMEETQAHPIYAIVRSAETAVALHGNKRCEYRAGGQPPENIA
ncbi:hypothetical protein MTO96_019865 [Rhipicephalus appendiculatus]